MSRLRAPTRIVTPQLEIHLFCNLGPPSAKYLGWVSHPHTPPPFGWALRPVMLHALVHLHIEILFRFDLLYSRSKYYFWLERGLAIHK